MHVRLSTLDACADESKRCLVNPALERKPYECNAARSGSPAAACAVNLRFRSTQGDSRGDGCAVAEKYSTHNFWRAPSCNLRGSCDSCYVEVRLPILRWAFGAWCVFAHGDISDYNHSSAPHINVPGHRRCVQVTQCGCGRAVITAGAAAWPAVTQP